MKITCYYGDIMDTDLPHNNNEEENDGDDECSPDCHPSLYQMNSIVSDVYRQNQKKHNQNQIIPDVNPSLLDMPSIVTDKFLLSTSSTTTGGNLFGFDFDFKEDSLSSFSSQESSALDDIGIIITK